jgi:hypothetical protein
LQQELHSTTTTHLKALVLTGPLWGTGGAHKGNPTMWTRHEKTNPHKKRGWCHFPLVSKFALQPPHFFHGEIQLGSVAMIQLGSAKMWRDVADKKGLRDTALAIGCSTQHAERHPMPL